jgi:hypothetical protein
LNPGPSLLTE